MDSLPVDEADLGERSNSLPLDGTIFLLATFTPQEQTFPKQKLKKKFNIFTITFNMYSCKDAPGLPCHGQGRSEVYGTNSGYEEEIQPRRDDTTHTLKE